MIKRINILFHILLFVAILLYFYKYTYRCSEGSNLDVLVSIIYFSVDKILIIGLIAIYWYIKPIWRMPELMKLNPVINTIFVYAIINVLYEILLLGSNIIEYFAFIRNSWAYHLVIFFMLLTYLISYICLKKKFRL